MEEDAAAHKRSRGDPDRGSQDGESPGEETTRLLETQEAFNEFQSGAAPPTTVDSVSSSTSTATDRGLHGSVNGATPTGTVDKKPEEVIAWKDLPRKGQLIVITLTRLSEPLVQTSLQSYMFYQLRWFDPSLPDSVISSQAGILHASFTATQFLTAMIWGRVADSSRFGRKTVVLIGLTGTMASSLGFGMSTSFWQALVFRSLGGATNGNVGVLRTMISEVVREKKYQRRAFLLLPMTFNIGVIIGPILGGFLADPANSYPKVLGNVEFFREYPYALPNLFSAFYLFSAALFVWLCLDEVSLLYIYVLVDARQNTDVKSKTLDARIGKVDWGRELGKKIGSALYTFFSRRQNNNAYERLATSEDGNTSFEMSPSHSRNVSTSSSIGPVSSPSTTMTKRRPRYTQRLPFRRIFTRNVTNTLLSQSFLAFHTGTFNSLWFVFLSTPVYDPNKSGAYQQHLPFIFTGGMGLPPARVGLAMSILGVIGISLQLFIYPTISARLGTVRCLRIFLLFFPVAYFLAPFLSLVPSTSPPPEPKSGTAMWVSIVVVLLWQVVGRTFALPSGTLLVNNCSPHPSVLGTLHGLAQSCASAARTIGPMLCGYLYGLGLSSGVVGAVWWGLTGFAIVGWVVSWLIREGNGHEIWLEGDEDEEAAKETSTARV